MRLLIKNNYGGYLEEFDELESFEEVVNILNCFLKLDEILLFSFLEQNLNRDWHPNDLPMKEIIEERTVFVSNEWVHSHERLNQGVGPRRIWFHPENKKELIESIQQDQLFTCVVLKSGSKLKEASYILHVFEGMDFQIMDIEGADPDDFKIRVLPKLTTLIRNMKIVEE